MFYRDINTLFESLDRKSSYRIVDANTKGQKDPNKVRYAFRVNKDYYVIRFLRGKKYSSLASAKSGTWEMTVSKAEKIRTGDSFNIRSSRNTDISNIDFTKFASTLSQAMQKFKFSKNNAGKFNGVVYFLKNSETGKGEQSKAKKFAKLIDNVVRKKISMQATFGGDFIAQEKANNNLSSVEKNVATNTVFIHPKDKGVKAVFGKEIDKNDISKGLANSIVKSATKSIKKQKVATKKDVVTVSSSIDTETALDDEIQADIPKSESNVIELKETPKSAFEAQNEKEVTSSNEIKLFAMNNGLVIDEMSINMPEVVDIFDLDYSQNTYVEKSEIDTLVNENLKGLDYKFGDDAEEVEEILDNIHRLINRANQVYVSLDGSEPEIKGNDDIVAVQDMENEINQDAVNSVLAGESFIDIDTNEVVSQTINPTIEPNNQLGGEIDNSDFLNDFYSKENFNKLLRQFEEQKQSIESNAVSIAKIKEDQFGFYFKKNAYLAKLKNLHKFLTNNGKLNQSTIDWFNIDGGYLSDSKRKYQPQGDTFKSKMDLLINAINRNARYFNSYTELDLEKLDITELYGIDFNEIDLKNELTENGRFHHTFVATSNGVETFDSLADFKTKYNSIGVIDEENKGNASFKVTNRGVKIDVYGSYDNKLDNESVNNRIMPKEKDIDPFLRVVNPKNKSMIYKDVNELIMLLTNNVTIIKSHEINQAVLNFFLRQTRLINAPRASQQIDTQPQNQDNLNQNQDNLNRINAIIKDYEDFNNDSENDYTADINELKTNLLLHQNDENKFNELVSEFEVFINANEGADDIESGEDNEVSRRISRIFNTKNESTKEWVTKEVEFKIKQLNLNTLPKEKEEQINNITSNAISENFIFEFGEQGFQETEKAFAKSYLEYTDVDLKEIKATLRRDLDYSKSIINSSYTPVAYDYFQQALESRSKKKFKELFLLASNDLNDIANGSKTIDLDTFNTIKSLHNKGVNRVKELLNLELNEYGIIDEYVKLHDNANLENPPKYVYYFKSEGFKRDFGFDQATADELANNYFKTINYSNFLNGTANYSNSAIDEILSINDAQELEDFINNNLYLDESQNDYSNTQTQQDTFSKMQAQAEISDPLLNATIDVLGGGNQDSDLRKLDTDFAVNSLESYIDDMIASMTPRDKSNSKGYKDYVDYKKGIIRFNRLSNDSMGINNANRSSKVEDYSKAGLINYLSDIARSIVTSGYKPKTKTSKALNVDLDMYAKNLDSKYFKSTGQDFEPITSRQYEENLNSASVNGTYYKIDYDNDDYVLVRGVQNKTQLKFGNINAMIDYYILGNQDKEYFEKQAQSVANAFGVDFDLNSIVSDTKSFTTLSYLENEFNAFKNEFDKFVTKANKAIKSNDIYDYEDVASEAISRVNDSLEYLEYNEYSNNYKEKGAKELISIVKPFKEFYWQDDEVSDLRNVKKYTKDAYNHFTKILNAFSGYLEVGNIATLEDQDIAQQVQAMTTEEMNDINQGVRSNEGTYSLNGDAFEIKRQDGRITFHFSGKPSQETRTALKGELRARWHGKYKYWYISDNAGNIEKLNQFLRSNSLNDFNQNDAISSDPLLDATANILQKEQGVSTETTKEDQINKIVNDFYDLCVDILNNPKKYKKSYLSDINDGFRKEFLRADKALYDLGTSFEQLGDKHDQMSDQIIPRMQDSSPKTYLLNSIDTIKGKIERLILPNLKSDSSKIDDYMDTQRSNAIESFNNDNNIVNTAINTAPIESNLSDSDPLLDATANILGANDENVNQVSNLNNNDSIELEPTPKSTENPIEKLQDIAYFAPKINSNYLYGAYDENGNRIKEISLTKYEIEKLINDGDVVIED